MFALGAGELLVGRSQQCDFPEAAKKLPSAGGYADPDVERVLALRPTLVIGEQGPAGPPLEKQLSAQGIATFFPPTRSLAEIDAMIEGLGERIGRAAEAHRLRAAIDADVARIAAWATGKKVRAVMVFDVKPLFVAGPGGFPDEVIRRAGGDNAITGGGAYPTIDLERLLALDPEVILDATDDRPGASRLGDSDGWRPLRAVRTGNVRKLGSAAALRPGPRIAEGIRAVAKALHGEDPPAVGHE